MGDAMNRDMVTEAMERAGIAAFRQCFAEAKPRLDNFAAASLVEAIFLAMLRAQPPALQEEVERDANGEAMMCEGCGTTKSIAAILAVNPMAIACCPERKMVEARHFWRNCAEPAEQEAVRSDEHWAPDAVRAVEETFREEREAREAVLGDAVERMTEWLYKREGGIAFHLLSLEDREHWRSQARAAIAALSTDEERK